MSRVQKVMTQPVNVIFSLLRSRQRVSVWLYEQPNVRLEGRIAGFDEYMNVVLDDCEEVDSKRGTRTALGRLLLKGDNISLLAPAAQPQHAVPTLAAGAAVSVAVAVEASS